MLDRRTFCGGVALGLGLAGSARAADLPAAVIDKAKAEGQVVWYTDLIVDQVVRPIAEAFQKTYGIRLVFTRGDSQETLLKVMSEVRAGRAGADLFSMTSGMQTLIDAGVTAPFACPNGDLLPADYRSAAHDWVATNIYSMTPAVNTDLVDTADYPKGYDDLLLPRWKGKMVWKPNDTSGAPGFIGTILTSMGEDRGMDYLRRLAGQKIRIVDASARGLLDQVIAGSYPMVLQIFNHHAAISAAQGAPVAWLPFSPSAVVLECAGRVKGGPNPNAAALLLNFLVSTQGQTIMQKASYLPASPDVPALSPDLKPSGGKFTGVVLSPALIAKGLDHWNDVFRTLFT
jgi:iron(III) transport system substrate-binding protein